MGAQQLHDLLVLDLPRPEGVHVQGHPLSATPIPRTLNMSLIGIKSMSIIAEPPEDRYPVETYVMEMQPHIIKAAIEKEIDRRRQVFIIYNRVKGIYKLAKEIADMLPTASVAVGHGRMNEKELEDIMLSFVKLHPRPWPTGRHP